MDKRKLENILDELQIKINTKGYDYWITAVEKHIENKELGKGNLYTEIAKVHNSTATRVERALRSSYSKSKEVIKEYFDISYDINNSILLELLTREMERKL